MFAFGSGKIIRGGKYVRGTDAANVETYLQQVHFSSAAGSIFCFFFFVQLPVFLIGPV